MLILNLLRFNSPSRLCGCIRSRHTAAAIGRLKNPPRGGQNLSGRYRRLEKSLRGKEVLVKGIGELTPNLSSNREERNKSTASPKKAVEMFHGLEVPQEPKAPESDECCMSGCALCVYDLYNESMDAYQDAVLAFCSSLSVLKIPRSEWPHSIQYPQASPSLPPAGSDRQRKEVVMNTFEELERKLEAKQHDTRETRVDSAGLHIITLPSTRRPAGSSPPKKCLRDWWTGLYDVICWIMFSKR